MFIAVSNAHGWGKGESEKAAIATAYRNSIVKDARVRITVWPCLPEASVNGHGEALGVTGTGHEFLKVGKQWMACREVGVSQ